jgi:hypothetical protein
MHSVKFLLAKHIKNHAKVQYSLHFQYHLNKNVNSEQNFIKYNHKISKIYHFPSKKMTKVYFEYKVMQKLS